MAIRFNPDGSITVGKIEEERQPDIVADILFEEVKKTEPKKKATPKKKKAN